MCSLVHPLHSKSSAQGTNLSTSSPTLAIFRFTAKVSKLLIKKYKIINVIVSVSFSKNQIYIHKEKILKVNQNDIIDNIFGWRDKNNFSSSLYFSNYLLREGTYTFR